MLGCSERESSAPDSTNSRRANLPGYAYESSVPRQQCAAHYFFITVFLLFFLAYAEMQFPSSESMVSVDCRSLCRCVLGQGQRVSVICFAVAMQRITSLLNKIFKITLHVQGCPSGEKTAPDLCWQPAHAYRGWRVSVCCFTVASAAPLFVIDEFPLISSCVCRDVASVG
jgi:hypothetical protein